MNILLTRQWQRLSAVKTIIIHKMDSCVGTQEYSPRIELVAVRKQSSSLTERKHGYCYSDNELRYKLT
jgi:hypothetical protein